MTRKEFFRQGWIHITTRLPKLQEGQNPRCTYVLCYYSKDGHFSMWLVEDAREFAKKVIKGEFEDISWDRVFDYWMPLVEPEGCISATQYFEKYYVDKKRKGRK